MPSDELRKKWGVIFMGDREATMEQLDAMQEPVLKERQQRDQTQEYIERVRKRAAERARVILGEAYAERQKVLSEANAEIEKMRAELAQEAEGIKAEVAALRKQAAEELARAKQAMLDAESVKSTAHEEGYQSGMDQASKELREFRADMGNELASIMRAIDGELSRITQIWREDLCELVRVAIASGTAFILDTQNEAILNNLVNEAINLLEKRETISFRVNPDDEAIVNDLFHAAREKAPEIRQWIVNSDEMVDRGGLVAESGSGSVDLRRENFKELVDSLLQHMALPVQDEDKKAAQSIHDAIDARAILYTGTQAADTEPSPEDEVEESTPAGGEGEPAEQDDAASPSVSLNDAPVEEASSDEAEQSPEPPLSAAGSVPNAEGENDAEAVKPAAGRRAKDISPENFPATVEQPDSNLADLEEELFPVNQDEEHAVLEGGGFLPDTRH